MSEITIREEYFTLKEKNFLIKIIFTGKEYIGCGYRGEEQMNEIKEKFDSEDYLEPDNPIIENLIYLLKEDIIESQNS